jgi:hypothetical protein
MYFMIALLKGGEAGQKPGCRAEALAPRFHGRRGGGFSRVAERGQFVALPDGRGSETTIESNPLIEPRP